MRTGACPHKCCRFPHSSRWCCHAALQVSTGALCTFLKRHAPWHVQALAAAEWPGLHFKLSTALQIFDSEGRIDNWAGYEAVLNFLFYKQLGWPAGDEGHVLMTANPITLNRADKEKLTQMLFEVFDVKGMFLLDSAVASVYAAGKASGVSLDIGLTGATVAQVRIFKDSQGHSKMCNFVNFCYRCACMHLLSFTSQAPCEAG